jgi:hypothetical protein
LIIADRREIGGLPPDVASARTGTATRKPTLTGLEPTVTVALTVPFDVLMTETLPEPVLGT